MAMDEKALYENRFSESEQERRLRLWPVLIESWLARWIKTTDSVLDLGSSDAAFINSIHASRRIAVDINPALSDAVDPSVEAFVGTLEDANLMGEVDVILASNIFEHLPSVEALLEVLAACRKALVPGSSSSSDSQKPGRGTESLRTRSDRIDSPIPSLLSEESALGTQLGSGPLPQVARGLADRR